MPFKKINPQSFKLLSLTSFLERKVQKRVFNQAIATFGAILGLGFSLASEAASVPAEVKSILSNAHIPYGDVSLWVAKARETTPVIALNPEKAMQPASCAKLLTTLAALEILGPNYRWKTRWLAESFNEKTGLVKGLTFVGGGDPHYVIERLWLAAERLKAIGVRTIEGDIGVDRKLFTVVGDAKPLDGQTDRAYNVEADAALVSQRSVCFEIMPDEEAGIARIVPIPRLAGFKTTKSVPLTGGACSDWKGGLKAKFTSSEATFKGAYPLNCGKKTWPATLWKPNEYLRAVFSEVFSEAGIAWKGSVTDREASPNARELLLEKSNPLSNLVVLTNKFSNNTMARHLFLSLSFADAVGMRRPATVKRSQAVLSQWLTRIGIDSERVFIENGSGLSRETHISAADLGRVLTYAETGPYAAEFFSSLPIAGVDGTMRKREVTGFSRLKTGRVKDVRSIAGLVRDTKGTDWTVVILINTKATSGAIPAIDGILSWVGAGNL